MGENNNNRIRPEDLEDGILLKDMEISTIFPYFLQRKKWASMERIFQKYKSIFLKFFRSPEIMRKT